MDLREHIPPTAREKLGLVKQEFIFLKRLVLRITNLGRTRAIRAQLDAIAAGRRDIDVFEDLVQAWDNPYSADARLLQEIAHTLDTTDGPVFEAGSGLTSVVCHRLATAAKRPFVCVEHDRQWYVLNRVDAMLSGCRGLRLVRAPLASYSDFAWYGIPNSVELPTAFNVVICDGPPGITEGGRYGVVPVLGSRVDDALILMDDADRPSEQRAIERWVQDAPAATVDMTDALGTSKAYAKVRLHPDKN